MIIICTLHNNLIIHDEKKRRAHLMTKCAQDFDLNPAWWVCVCCAFYVHRHASERKNQKRNDHKISQNNPMFGGLILIHFNSNVDYLMHFK